jgi:hypothetical protein
MESRDINDSTWSGKRKHGFIENDIARDIDATGTAIKTLITFVHGAITKEHTHLGTEL